MRKRLPWLAVMSAVLLLCAACGDDDGSDTNVETICSDGWDNDGDMLIDCADPDCETDPYCTGNIVCGDGICTSPTETAESCPEDCDVEICDNLTDDDGDGMIDCGDSDCQGDPACENPSCPNGLCEAGEDAESCPEDCAGGGCTSVQDMVNQLGCGTGEGCGVDQNNDIACVAEGTVEHYEDCSAGTCLAGAMCASSGDATPLCHPFCNTETGEGCPGEGACLYYFETNQGNVGLCALPDTCEAVENTGCDAGEACYFVGSQGDTSCMAEGTMEPGSECASASDCLPPALCLSGTPNLCVELCYETADCTTGACGGSFVGLPPEVGYCQ